MNERLAWLALTASSAAILVSSWLESPAAIWPLAIGTALFPGALFLVAETGRRRLPLWIVALTLSLLAGMSVLILDLGEQRYLGLPITSWLCWLLLGLIPFVLTLYGVVFSASVPEDDAEGER
jgi:uncharacterized membrane protein YgdD (TMEM256/DUF423 family)